MRPCPSRLLDSRNYPFPISIMLSLRRCSWIRLSVKCVGANEITSSVALTKLLFKRYYQVTQVSVTGKAMEGLVYLSVDENNIPLPIQETGIDLYEILIMEKP